MFTSILLHHKLQSYLQWITKREMGGVYQTGDLHPKTGDHVLEKFKLNHPDARSPLSEILDSYRGPPYNNTQLDLNTDTVTEVARKLFVRDDLGGTDYASLQNWLLQFLEESVDLRLVLASFTDW